MSWVTIHTHRGVGIKIKSPAKLSEMGYVIDHPDFIGQTFLLIQHAIDAIDRNQE